MSDNTISNRIMSHFDRNRTGEINSKELKDEQTKQAGKNLDQAGMRSRNEIQEELRAENRLSRKMGGVTGKLDLIAAQMTEKAKSDIIKDVDQRIGDTFHAMVQLDPSAKDFAKKLFLIQSELASLKQIKEGVKMAPDIESAEALAKLDPEAKDFEKQLFLLSHEKSPLNDTKGNLVGTLSDQINDTVEAIQMLDPSAPDFQKKLLMARANLDAMQQMREGVKTAPDEKSAQAIAQLDPEAKDFEKQLFLLSHGKNATNAAKGSLIGNLSDKLNQAAASMRDLDPEAKDFQKKLLAAHAKLEGLAKMREAIKTAPDEKSAQAIAQLDPQSKDFEKQLFLLSHEKNALNHTKGSLIGNLSDKINQTTASMQDLDPMAKDFQKKLLMTQTKLDALKRMMEGIKTAPDEQSAQEIAQLDPQSKDFARRLAQLS